MTNGKIICMLSQIMLNQTQIMLNQNLLLMSIHKNNKIPLGMIENSMQVTWDMIDKTREELS